MSAIILRKPHVREKSGSRNIFFAVNLGIGYWMIRWYALLLISHYRLKIWPWNFQEIIWALLWVESANKIFRFFCKKLFLTLTFASALFIQEHYKYVLLSDNILGRCLEISWNALVTWCHAGIPAKKHCYDCHLSLSLLEVVCQPLELLRLIEGRT